MSLPLSNATRKRGVRRSSMRAINVLGIQRLSAEDARRIEAIEPRIR
jgi:hypothetical protein